MTRIDFYVLNDSQAHARQVLACKLAQKAMRSGYRVFLHTADPAQTKSMDDLLWTFSQKSFVPHTTVAEEASSVPVYIAHDDEPQDIHDVLINLHPDTPTCFSRFERMAELLDQAPETLKAGRERYRFYQDRGYPLQTHKL